MIGLRCRFFNISIFFSLFLFVLLPFTTFAQSTNIDASKLLARVEAFLSPRTGSFVQGTTFDVPILINTKGSSINGVEIQVSFDQNKLSIVRPAGGTSIIGLWVESPSYDNTHGTARYVGVIPGGITTQSGLIGTITFEAKATGSAVVSFKSNSKVLLNDGLGTEAIVDFGRAEYKIIPSAPGGVNIYSDTHPFQNDWYNNNSPVISWDKDSDVDGFSYVLDNKPNTIPENIINTTATVQSYENLANGLWYFHIKANKKGIWGSTGHFLLRIDTAPPADFKPEVNYLMAATVLVERTLVSFFTTDNLSGVDHYEVGIIDKSQPTTVSPSFVRTESPFQIPIVKDANLRVIVRAIDKAGNIRDASIDIAPPVLLLKFFKDNLIWILIILIFVGLLGMILHYFIGHHIRRGFRKIERFGKSKDKEERSEMPTIEQPLPPQIVHPIASQAQIPIEGKTKEIEIRPIEIPNNR